MAGDLSVRTPDHHGASVPPHTHEAGIRRADDHDVGAVAVPVADARLLVLLLPMLRARVRTNPSPVALDVLDALGRLLAAVRSTDYSTSSGSAEVPQAPGRDWLTSDDVAAALGITPRAVRKRCLAGTLRAARDRTGRWLIDPTELEQPCRQRTA